MLGTVAVAASVEAAGADEVNGRRVESISVIRH